MFGFEKAPSHTSDVGFGLDVSPDKQAFTLTFGNLQAAVRSGGALPPMATRLFELALPLEDGGTGVEIAFTIQGFVLTPEGATGTMVFSVNGQSVVADFPGKSDQSFQQQLKFAADTPSECRLCVFLVAGRDSKKPDVEAYLNVTAIDATIQPRKK